MSADPKLSREEFIAQMRAEMEAMLAKVADAVNDAPPGRIIAGSEEPVRDLFAEFRECAFRESPADETRRGGSRFSPLRRTKAPARPNAIKDARTSPCSRSTDGFGSDDDAGTLPMKARVRLWMPGSTPPRVRSAWACVRWPAGSTATARTLTRPRPTSAARCRFLAQRRDASGSGRDRGQAGLAGPTFGKTGTGLDGSRLQNPGEDDADLSRQRWRDGADGHRG